jgi:hypothetical protein
MDPEEQISKPNWPSGATILQALQEQKTDGKHLICQLNELTWSYFLVIIGSYPLKLMAIKLGDKGLL